MEVACDPAVITGYSDLLTPHLSPFVDSNSKHTDVQQRIPLWCPTSALQVNILHYIAHIMTFFCLYWTVYPAWVLIIIYADEVIKLAVSLSARKILAPGEEENLELEEEEDAAAGAGSTEAFPPRAPGTAHMSITVNQTLDSLCHVVRVVPSSEGCLTVCLFCSLHWCCAWLHRLFLPASFAALQGTALSTSSFWISSVVREGVFYHIFQWE